VTRPHDMGGRFGDGPVVPEPEGVTFHADWHPRALALTLAAGALGQWSIDDSRRARESLAPVDYARFSYYEKWIAALADLLAETGTVSRAELAGRDAPAPSPLAVRRLAADAVAGMLARGGPAFRDGAAPRFALGDRVAARRWPENMAVPGGHTRLPAYAAGAQGTVLRCHGCHVFPDSHAEGGGEAPQPLYAVAFPASALWAHPEHPGDEVVLDLWESYLEPIA
jgi:nitrile hydratase subunit beta